MDKKKIAVDAGIIVAALVLAAALTLLWWGRDKNGSDEEREAKRDEPIPEARAYSENRTPLSRRVDVPGETTDNMPDRVAIPKTVAPVASGRPEKQRVFDIVIQNGKFSPDTVIVSLGDVALISFASFDRNYNVVQPDYGFSLLVPEGEHANLEFGATAAGTFTFFCSMCGGPEKGPVGSIVVSP